MIPKSTKLILVVAAGGVFLCWFVLIMLPDRNLEDNAASLMMVHGDGVVELANGQEVVKGPLYNVSFHDDETKKIAKDILDSYPSTVTWCYKGKEIRVWLHRDNEQKELSVLINERKRRIRDGDK